MPPCPFNKFKPCRPECSLYAEEPRTYDAGPTVVVKGCSFRLMWDELKSINQRLAMIQAETGETKNANLLLALSLVGDPRGPGELARMAMKKKKELDNAPNAGKANPPLGRGGNQE